MAESTQTDTRTAEEKAKSVTVSPKGLDKEVIAWRQVFDLDAEAVTPFWQTATRMKALYRGRLPDELNGTFSKIMLNTAYAIVQERIGLLQRNLFAQEYGSPTLTGDSPLAAMTQDQAQAWIRNMMYHPRKLNMPAEFLARTLPETCETGTAYRLPYVTMIKDDDDKPQAVINSKHVDYFQILPAASGGFINPLDRVSEDVLPHFHWIDWWTNDQIRAYSKFDGYNEEQATMALKSHPTSNESFDTRFHDVSGVVGGVDFGRSKKDYRNRMNMIDGVDGRKRTVLWFRRGKLTIIVQDRYKIYSGPGPLPNNLLPLAVYQCCPFGNSVHGISGIEMVEDLIRAHIMNFNFRSDYLAKIMFPAKWIRDDVMQGKPAASFIDRPYSTYNFPQSVQDIRKAVHYDRMPEVTPQSFQEEAVMERFIQNNYGLTDFSQGSGRMSDNRTATGIVSLINQAQGRLITESFILEKLGLANEIQLLLSFGAKFITDDIPVETSRPDGGFDWSTVESDALAESYTVHTHSTGFMQEKDQSFQKLQTLYPLWNQDPLINQPLLREELGRAANVFRNLDAMMVAPEAPSLAGAALEGLTAGPDQGQPVNITNEARREQRTTVVAGGARRPANQAL